MPIKTFKGLMADGAQDIIVLHTNSGSTGYRIVKFDILGNTPFAADSEAIIKIYKVAQSTIDATVDMSDQTLLAVATATNRNANPVESGYRTILFDQDIVNQDIYVTYKNNQGSEKCNYYIELEQIKLDLNENTVATLKDIRNSA
jgi:hypothetical protein